MRQQRKYRVKTAFKNAVIFKFYILLHIVKKLRIFIFNFWRSCNGSKQRELNVDLPLSNKQIDKQEPTQCLGPNYKDRFHEGPIKYFLVFLTTNYHNCNYKQLSVQSCFLCVFIRLIRMLLKNLRLNSCFSNYSLCLQFENTCISFQI
jgi:hypothetical protein